MLSVDDNIVPNRLDELTDKVRGMDKPVLGCPLLISGCARYLSEEDHVYGCCVNGRCINDKPSKSCEIYKRAREDCPSY